MPPAIHPSRQRYRWGEGRSLLDLATPELPPAVCSALRAVTRPPAQPPQLAAAPQRTPNSAMFCLLRGVTREFLSGWHAESEGWNNRLYGAACDMAANGWGLEAATESLLRGARPRTEADRRAALATIHSAFSRPRTPSRGVLSFSLQIKPKQ